MDDLLWTVLATSFRVWRTAAVLVRWTIGARTPSIEPGATGPDRTDTVCHIVGRWPDLSGQAEGTGYAPPQLPSLPRERLLKNAQELAEAIISFPRPYMWALPSDCKAWLLTYLVSQYWLRCYHYRSLEAVSSAPSCGPSDRTLPRYARLQEALRYHGSDTRVQNGDTS
jgi:hypothetical protein